MLRDDLWPVVVGALLHDIGKVVLRTDLPEVQAKARQYCRGSKPHADFSSCRECSAEYGYLHAMLGEIEALELLPDALRGAAYIVGSHHRASRLTTDVQIVALADRLSAAEREQAEENKDGSQRLRSLLSDLMNGAGMPQYFPLKPLSLEGHTIFPSQQVSDEPAKSYRELWNGLRTDLVQLKGLYSENPENYFEGLLAALQIWLWSVPSAYYRDAADVSLFEHLRLTAAFSAALRLNQSLEATAIAGALAGNDSSASDISFDLVIGDISGLQAFLYTLTSKAVARGLKGRSFYLDMLTELTGRWVLQKLGLPLSNMIYSGGGRFYVLSYPLADRTFSELRQQLATEFWRAFEGRLYLALARSSFSAAEILIGQGDGYAKIWTERLGRALAETKSRRFAELAYAPFGTLGNGEEPCAICGREGASVPLPDDEQQRKICRTCHELAELGRDLADAKFLEIGRHEAGNVSNGGLWPFLGFEVRAVPQLSGSAKVIIGIGDPSQVFPTLLKEVNRLPAGKRPSLALRFLPKVVPRVPGGPGVREISYQIASFTELAEASEGSDLLGVLRLDVDNLGRVFGAGLGSRASPSRLATLSFLMRIFFEGWIGQLCSSLDPKGRHLYLIYSGGDDVFVVGSWHLMPELALTIRDEFRRFTRNDNLTLSAGIFLAPKKLPLYQTAGWAKLALEAAKARTQNGQVVKDAVNFLGKTWSWSTFKEVKSRGEFLRDRVKAAELPRSVLHKVGHLYWLQEMDRLRIRNQRGRPHYGPWVWRAVYYLARTAERHGELEAELRRWAVSITKDPHMLEELAYAARWAELLTQERYKEVSES